MEVYDFGYRLRDLRKKKGLSQEDVAGRLGLTASAVSAYENNTALPPSDKLAQLALLYNVSTDYLLNLDKRRSVYLDGLSESQQESVVNIVEAIVQEIKIAIYKAPPKP